MRAAWVVALVLATACGSEDSSYDYTSKGAALYQQMCQVCHGEIGEGGLGPALLDTKKSHKQLENVIAERMPANNPGQCTGECATEIASFIKDGLTSSALRCDAVPPAPRRLRLLTRREYRATVKDLFGDRAPVMACPRATDCAFRDTCDAGTCEPTACDAQTFVFDPQGRNLSSVHVAGSFNNWASTIAGGGLALTYSSGLWVGTFAIAQGSHQYKLVLEERDWIADPRAPSSQPDGFGGQNSAFTLSCSGEVARDAIASLPAESRPSGFPFDTDADSALVTAMHVDAYLAAAEQLADHATPELSKQFTTTRDMVEQVGKRVFRRPLTSDEVSKYGDLEMATALHAMLVSPSFLYRSEIGDNGRLTGYEVATALSYTLLGTTPSDELLAAAGRGELGDAKGIERHARALLDDPRARDQIGELVLQWTGGEAVLTAEKRRDLFPGFDDATRAALAKETREFAAAVVFEGSGTLRELLTADYTILDATAAKFYGVSGQGKVAYDGKRAGLLGHASILAATAHSDQTSPIRRGLFIRRNFLCQELPPPPPFAGGVPDVDPNATTRERFAMHTSNPVCAGCHRYIDGVGFGLEHFDPVGRWRATEAGKPIDASGNLNDVERLGTGTDAPYATLPELAAAIANSRAAQSCFTRQYLRFTRGMRETLAQRCGRLWLEDKLEAANGDLRELVIQAVLAPDFVRRR